MQGNHEARVIALTIQWGGVAIITLLSFLMAQSVRRRVVEYWTLAWACLTLGLTSLLIAYSLPKPPAVCYSVYFFAEYLFAFLFLAGCRNHAEGVEVTRESCWILLPAGGLALGLPFLAGAVGLPFVPHSAVLAGAFVRTDRVFQGVRRRDQRAAGTSVVSVALIVLTIFFLHNVVVYSYGSLSGKAIPFAYMTYAPLYELLVEVLLAFGTVILLMESVCRQLEGKNNELTAASAQLQTLAETDPLTETLNRYAFYSLVEKGGRQSGAPMQGSVALVDVDDFKSINDTLGHAAGDAAIRAVAGAIRSVIRADDLLFRWGGDEFLVVLVGVNGSEARERLAQLNIALLNTNLAESDATVDLRVSFGVASFDHPELLERTIEEADREMYNHKQSRKAGLNLAAVVDEGPSNI